MASKKITAMPNWAGAQIPTDLLTGVDLSQPVATQNVKSTLDDLFATITKNITDVSVQWQSGDGVATVSAASNGKVRYSQAAVSAAGSFQVSENGAAYQNLIKGPASAGNLTANLLPFATAGDVVGDTALAQLGATTSRVLSFNAHSPGLDLSAYGANRVSVVDQSGFQSVAILGILPSIKGIFFGGTAAAPTAATANANIFSLRMAGQYSTTAGQTSNSVTLDAYATEAWSASRAGAAFTLRTNANGVSPNNQVARLTVNQLGAVCIRPNEAFGASSTGTGTLFQMGQPLVNDNDALFMLGDPAPNTGSAAVKILVLQQKPGQTGAIYETQYTDGTSGFAIKPVASVQGHFLDWLGTANPPAVSAAGKARLYVDASGLIQISQNGGAYSAIATAASSAPGGSSGNLQWNNGGAFAGVSGLTASSSGLLTLAATSPNNVLIVKEAGLTPPSTVDGFQILLNLHAIDDSVYVPLAFSSQATNVRWYGYLFSDGSLQWNGSDEASRGGVVNFYPEGITFAKTILPYGAILFTTTGSYGLGITSGSPTSGQTEVLTWNINGVGINKTTSIGAQLHVVSGSASRISGIFDTAASPTERALSLRVNGTEFAAFTQRSTFNRVAIAAPGSPSDGDSWRDSTQKAIAYRESGITTFGPQAVFTATASGQVANTTTETTLLGSGIGNKTLPANFFAPGKTLRITLKGIYSTAVVPGTLNIKAKFGSTILAQTTALTPAGTVTDLYWEVVVDITCRTTGGTGTVFAEGRFNHQDDTTTRGEFIWGMTNTGTTTIDTTASQVVDITATWATASASNDLRCTIITVEALN